MSPEGTQEGNKEYLPTSSHQSVATLEVSPEETQDEKTQDTGPRELRYISKSDFSEARLCIFLLIGKS